MSENPPAQPQVILCDMCTEEERMPAQKTCMKCEISMCLGHLQAHLTTPVLLQTHPLTEPTALCGANKCPQHGKLLEYYCLDDMACVCVSCAIEDQHRLHNMKTFSTAHKELLEKLKQDQGALRKKVQGNNSDIEKWEKTEGEKVRSSGVRLIEAVTHLRDLALTSVQSSVSGRMAAMKTSGRSIQAAQYEKDTFRFLQMHSQVHQDVEKAKAVDLRHGLEPSGDRDALVRQLRQGGGSLLKHANHFWRALLTLVDPENHQNIDGPYSDLIFQPMNSSSLSLSRDRRKLFYNSQAGQGPVTLQIANLKSIGSIQKWRVRFSKDCDWTTGLCDKQRVRTYPDELVYALSCDGDQLSSHIGEYVDRPGNPKSVFGGHTVDQTQRNFTSSSTPITFEAKSGDQGTQRPTLVEVEWNFETSSLSFYNRIGELHREKIFAFKLSLIPWGLVPFVKIKKIKNTSQEHWTCCCGEKDITRMRMNGRCSCGAPFYNAVTTEKVCELK